LNTTCI